KTGIPSEELGRVHLFDNYSFIDIPEPHTEKIIATVDGSPFKGRTIEIKPAKKKSEQTQDKEQNE
ncbi:MAG TPA: DbpA RNA binding domain-containing protein, partial [Rectinemataceae bacterium]|nr:DbpA RNA binding domain-containing protein [Rectinemataceae bacterium]